MSTELKTKSEIRIEIAAAIRQARKLAGLTTKDMAEHIKCSGTQYNKYERGVINIRLHLLHKIIEGLRKNLTTVQFNALGLNKYSRQVSLASTLAAYSENCFGRKINEEVLNAIANNVHNELLAEFTRNNAKPNPAIIES